MKNENKLIELSNSQSDPYLCDPIEIEVLRDDEPFHGQCSDKLQRQADAECQRTPSKYRKADHPDVNDAAKPGDGLGSRKSAKR
jgi:hypothetical protein